MGLKIIRKESSFQQISKRWTNSDHHSSGSDGESGSEEASNSEAESSAISEDNKSEKKAADDKPSQPGRSRPEHLQTTKEAKDRVGSMQRAKPPSVREQDDQLTPKKGIDGVFNRTFADRGIDIPLTQPRRAATQRIPQLISMMPFNDENDFKDKPSRPKLTRPESLLDHQLDEMPRALRSGSKSGALSPHRTSTNKERMLERDGWNDSKGKGSFPKDPINTLSPIRSRPNQSGLATQSRAQQGKPTKVAPKPTTSVDPTDLLPLEEIALSASKVPPRSKVTKANPNKTSLDGSRTGDSLQSVGLNLRNLTEPEPDLVQGNLKSSEPKGNQSSKNDSRQNTKKSKSNPKVFVADSTHTVKASTPSQTKPELNVRNFMMKEFQTQPLRRPDNFSQKPTSEFHSLHFNTKSTHPPMNQDRNPAFTTSAFKVTSQGMDYHPALTTRVSEAEQPQEPPKVPAASQPTLNLHTFHTDVAIPNPKKPEKAVLRPAESEAPEHPTPEQLEQINQNTKRYLDQTRDDSSYNTDVLNTMYQRNNEQNEIPEIPLKNIIPIKDKSNALLTSQQEAIEISSPQASEVADERDRSGRELFQHSTGRVGHEESYLLLSAEQREFYKRTDQELFEFQKRFQEWAGTLQSRDMRKGPQDAEGLFLEFRKALSRSDLSKIPLEVLYNHQFGYSLNTIFEILQQNRDSIPPRYSGLLATLQECLEMWNKRVDEDLFYSEDLNEKFQIPRANREKPALGKRAPNSDLDGPRLLKPTLYAMNQPKQEDEHRNMSLGSLSLPLQQPAPVQSKKAQQLEALIDYIEKVLLETHQLSEASRAAQNRGMEGNPIRWSLNERTKQEAVNMLTSGLRRCPGTPQEKQMMAVELESKIRSLRNKDEQQYWRAVQAVAEHLSRETFLKQQEVLGLARSDLSQFNLYLSAITELNMFVPTN